MKNTIDQIREKIEQENTRSAWRNGVKAYALELLEQSDDNYGSDAGVPSVADLLNGAHSWHQYIAGGCALIYNEEISCRLCTASELKRTKYGERNPNARETWLDVQARALHQAAAEIVRVGREVSAC